MIQDRQFSIGGLLGLILALGIMLGTLQVAGRIWLFALPVIGCVLAVCLVTTRSHPLEPRHVNLMLMAVTLPAIWLLWWALFPSMYYMEADGFLAPIYWLGVAAVAFWGAARSTVVVGEGPVAQLGCPRRQKLCFLIPAVVTLLIALRLPLLVGFLTTWPGLMSLVERVGPLDATGTRRPPWDAQMELAGAGATERLADFQSFGVYSIDLKRTYRCHVPGRVVFMLANEQDAFVYSPNGLDDLCFNAGTTGHFFGNWYWMTED